ncbi:MAG: dihydroneopterin aldolase [Anaerolineae bacterium]
MTIRETDTIFIHDLLARGIIGVNAWEREKPQDILMNIEVAADLRAAGEADSLESSANYRTIAKRAIARAETAGRFTVEALANDIASICLEEPAVVEARVRVEKPGAVRFARSVGVEVVRLRQDK